MGSTYSRAPHSLKAHNLNKMDETIKTNRRELGKSNLYPHHGVGMWLLGTGSHFRAE